MADIDQAKKTAKRFANQLSIEELKILREISVGLNPRKADKMTKREWWEKYEEHKIHYKLFSKTFQDELKVMNKMNKGLTKRQLQKAMANAIRERQEEIGLKSYLMNTVRISLFKTHTRYFNNPTLLEE